MNRKSIQTGISIFICRPKTHLLLSGAGSKLLVSHLRPCVERFKNCCFFFNLFYPGYQRDFFSLVQVAQIRTFTTEPLLNLIVLSVSCVVVVCCCPCSWCPFFIFCSCVCFYLYGPFECISFHKFS